MALWLPASWPDGSQAATNGTFQNSNFFNNCRQSSQTYVTRPPWYVAGVDYQIGVSASSYPLKIPGIDSLPTGFSAPDNTGLVTVFPSAGNILLDGWDFTGFRFGAIGTGDNNLFTIKNCFYRCTANGGDGTGVFNFQLTSSPVRVVVQNCTVDGNATNFTSSNYGGFVFLDSNPTPLADSLSVTYCALLDLSGTQFRNVGSGDGVLKYNYCEFNLNVYSHGELFSPQSVNPVLLYQQDYNLVYTKSTSYCGPLDGGVTGNVVVFIEGTTIDTVRFCNNTLVANKSSSSQSLGNNTSAYLITPLANGAARVKNVLYDSNYLDPTGVFAPIRLQGSLTADATTFRNNRNLLDNSIITGYS